MDARVPLPTDNVYKFLALFGLTLIITMVYLLFQQTAVFNERAFQRHITVAVLKATPTLNAQQQAEYDVLLKQREIDTTDRVFIRRTLGSLIGFGFILLSYGFARWHQVLQPLQDRLLTKQLEQIELDIATRRRARWRPDK